MISFNRISTTSLIYESACMTTKHEVTGSILGTSVILNVDHVWNGVHPASWGQLGIYMIKKWRSWLRKSTLIDLTQSNANPIIPSYCDLIVSCRSLVDVVAPLGSLRFYIWPPSNLNSMIRHYRHYIMINLHGQRFCGCLDMPSQSNLSSLPQGC